MIYSGMICLVLASNLISAEPWHPKQFEGAVSKSHAGYKPKRFMDVIGENPKKVLGLIGHNHGSVKKVSLRKESKKKFPFASQDGDDDDEFVYGEHADDGPQDVS